LTFVSLGYKEVLLISKVSLKTSNVLSAPNFSKLAYVFVPNGSNSPQ